MAFLTKSQILAAPDIRTETVEVPEWGGQVLVRGLTGTDRDKFESSVVDIGASTPDNVVTHTENMRAELAARGIVDASGDLMFAPADIVALGEKSAAALDRVCDVIKRLSGMAGGSMEAARKNSPGLTVVSSSDSPVS